MSSGKNRTDSKVGLGFSLRLSLFYGLFAAALAIGVFALAFYYIVSSVREGEYRWLEERANEYRVWYREGGLQMLVNRIEEQGQGTGEFFFVGVHNAGEAIQYLKRPSHLEPSDLEKLRAAKPDQRGRYQLRFGEDTWTIIEEPFISDGSYIRLGRSLQGGATVLRKFEEAVAWIGIPALLVGILGGTWLTFRALGPIRRLIGTIREILDTGDLDKRAEARSSQNELNALVRLFNELLGRNQKLVRAMRDSLDCVAHDLRTPMMRLRVTAEGAIPDVKEPIAKEKLGEILEETESMQKMLEMLMDVSEAESGAMLLKKEQVVVADLCSSVVSVYEFVAEEKEIRLIEEVPESLTVHADPARLRQAVANLADNAIKYSPAGSTVRFIGKTEGKDIVITVRDEGPGIPQEEQARIWERLYRIDASRHQPGLGLGLSLVKAIATAHGGDVRVLSEPGEGAAFSLILPRR